MKGFLFLVHIGPIQAFIASSRRTRDLYYGSGLLSEISKLVAATIVGLYTITSLIFPAPEDGNELKAGSMLDVANKVVAHLPAGADPGELGKQIKDEIKKYLTKRAGELEASIDKELLKDPGSAGKLEVKWEVVQAQLEDLIECYWVALPFDEGDYPNARLKLEAIMAARKNARLFQQPTWSSEQRKSSISGELEGVLPETLYPKERNLRREQIHPDARWQLQHNADKLAWIFRAGPAERLSGVDLLKRRGTFQLDGPFSEEDDRNKRLFFPSTSHIAALPYLACLDGLSDSAKKVLREKWDFYIQQTHALAASKKRPIERIKGFRENDVLRDYDGGMLYGERLMQDTDYAANLALAQDALEDFFKKVDSYFEHKIEPSPYYAILVADGDGMGAVIDYQAKGKDGGKDGMMRHRRVTQHLAKFAQDARRIVKENDGVALYTGGDDVMAFLPLHRALTCGAQLAKAFSVHMGEFHNNDDKQSPTLSAGIAIVHHLELLQESLNIARAAEKRAKSVTNKNAVAITLAKRGGEHYSVAGHWDDVDRYITQLIQFYASRSIPKGIAYNIRETVLRLEGLKHATEDAAKDAENATNIIRADIQRILLRRLPTPHQTLEPDTRERDTEKVPEGHEAATLYELLQARIYGTPELFGEVVKLRKKKENLVEVLIQPIRDARGNIDFHEFANELLIAQSLAETMMLLNTKRLSDTKQKEQQA
jgi:CRISPR-associated protein Cmr2